MKYSAAVKPDFFEKCPKEVFAAIAVSFIMNHQNISRSDQITKGLEEEWKLLYSQGLVSQKPKKWKERSVVNRH